MYVVVQGGRSTPDDLSWDSDDYSDNSEEEVDEKGKAHFDNL